MHKHESPMMEVSTAPPGAVRVDPGHGPGEVSPDPGPTPGRPHVLRESPGVPDPPPTPGFRDVCMRLLLIKA